MTYEPTVVPITRGHNTIGPERREGPDGAPAARARRASLRAPQRERVGVGRLRQGSGERGRSRAEARPRER